MEKIGSKIREIIRKRGITQNQLAKEMGRSVTLVSLWLSNERDMSTDDIKKFCKICKTTPNYLFGFDDEITEQDKALLSAFKAMAAKTESPDQTKNIHEQTKIPANKERT